MFAVVRTGGKQYCLEPGMELDVEKLPGEVGDSVALSDVLLVGKDEKSVSVGQPNVDGAVVNGKIIEQKLGKKVRIFKKIRRQGKQLSKGHRQPLTRIRIEDITA